MSQESLVVFARIVPKTEFFDDAKAAIIGIIPQTRAEAGCHAFVLHEGQGDDRNLYLYEVFEDQAALDRHYDQQYTKDVFAKYETWLAEPVQVTKMSFVS